MVAKQKLTLVVGLVLGLAILGALVLAVAHAHYNSSVDSDLQTLAGQAMRNNTGKPLVSLSQLAMPDNLRVRQLDRGYSLESSSSQPRVCGKEYSPVWAFTPHKQICFSESE